MCPLLPEACQERLLVRTHTALAITPCPRLAPRCHMPTSLRLARPRTTPNKLNMVGRDRDRGAEGSNDLIERMTQILETMVHNQGRESVEYQGLSAFTRHDPPKFEGGFNLEGAQRWLADVEEVFNAMGCHEEHKVSYATYLLCGEAENWWRFAGQTLPQKDGYVQWETFKAIFLGNYFPRDLRKQKVREFLELKQGSMTVEEYATKFQELMKYWPHYQHGDGEKDLCAQFEHRLRPDIRATVSVFQLTDLPTLMSKSRIFEANSRGKMVDTGGAGPMRQDRRPPRFSKGPYSGLGNSQFRGSSSQEKSSGSGSRLGSFRGPLKYFRCEGPHMVRDCPQSRATCSNCGKSGHNANGRLLDVLFDSGATHSFISVDCVKSLNLYVTELPCNVVVTTPTGKLVMTSWVCLECSMMVHGREFEADLICLPLSQLDVILRMDWLAANHVLLDCREKNLVFGVTITEVPRLMGQGAWKNTVNAKVFMVIFSMETESVVEPEYIPVVRDFLEVFPKDISELPPEREIEFAIDLIPGANSISVAPYKMSPVELAEVKKQVEDLLQIQFVRPSVSPWGAPVLLVKKKDGSMRMCVDYR
ncbi:uncharacterized protein LOC113871655 [Abrus precatorius]|uniref:Uncharacterized protein LOC113871655 n=1 Tax=Abrus precatorius TaxID=3816 RepID=A0A8B8M7A3_ABRPR|nr:uncharacterized protein LOC113871655 [Abrus precatorius]